MISRVVIAHVSLEEEATVIHDIPSSSSLMMDPLSVLIGVAVTSIKIFEPESAS